MGSLSANICKLLSKMKPLNKSTYFIIAETFSMLYHYSHCRLAAHAAFELLLLPISQLQMINNYKQPWILELSERCIKPKRYKKVQNILLKFLFITNMQKRIIYISIPFMELQPESNN